MRARRSLVVFGLLGAVAGAALACEQVKQAADQVGNQVSQAASSAGHQIEDTASKAANDAKNMALIGFTMGFEKLDWEKHAFTTLPAPTIERHLVDASALGGKLYVMGGVDQRGNYRAEVEAFDPKTGAWSRAADWPTPREAIGATVGNVRCFFDGTRGLGAAGHYEGTDCFDASANAWGSKSKPPSSFIPSYYAEHGGAAIGFVNGSAPTVDRDAGPPPPDAGPAAAVPLVLAYQPSADKWTVLPSPPVPRAGATVQQVGDVAYALGGESRAYEDKEQGSRERQDDLRQAWALDLGTRTWQKIAPMTRPHSPEWLRAVKIGDRVGALDLDSRPVLEIYDAKTKAWKAAKDPDGPLEPHHAWAYSHGDDVYLFAFAEATQQNASGRVLRFDGKKEEWSEVATHPKPSQAGEMVYLPVDLGDAIYIVSIRTTLGPQQAHPQ